MMEEIIIGFAILISIAAVVVVLLYRQYTKRILQNLDRMLDRAINGTFTADTLDETMYSAVENKLSRYLADSELSARNVAQEKEKIKTLIADISHQTKTPGGKSAAIFGIVTGEKSIRRRGRVCRKAPPTGRKA